MIGKRIKQRRNEIELTLRELAKSADISPGYLSKIENDLAKPSLDVFQAIATALQVPMFYFWNSTPQNPVVRANEEQMLGFHAEDITYELMTPDTSHQMMSVKIKMKAGSKRVAPPLSRPNEQWMYVLKGQLEINIDGIEYRLGVGDSIYFDGNLLREYSTGKGEDLIMVCCIVPPAL